MKPKTGNNANGLRLLTRGAVYVAMVAVFLVGRAFTQSPTPASDYELKRINLPGATGAVALDYFAHDRATGKLWVPASNTGSVDVIDAKTFTRGECVPASPDRDVTPDGVLYVTATHEVWITTRPTLGADPAAAKSLQVFDASDPQRLKWKSKIPVDDLAEGYAVENDRGLFYTNIEDAGVTVAVDVRSRDIVAKW